MRFKKLYENSKAPTKATDGSAGFDLYADHHCKIEWGSTEVINTGIAIEIPRHYVGLIFARSGLATKHGIRPANCVGVIDSDYRGEIMVALRNDGFNDYEIHTGDRIAQIVIVPCLTDNLEESDHLSVTVRGDGGFGSTGE